MKLKYEIADATLIVSVSRSESRNLNGNSLNAKLRVEQKHEKPYDVELNKESLTIGRSSSNDLVFNHLSLSRHHARILQKDDAFLVEDTGSRNGTFLNGVRLRQATPLKSGDVIQLGEILLRFNEPLTDKLKVTDTAPALGFEATYMIDTDELNIKRYVQDAISGQTLMQMPGLLPAGENIWPALNQAASTLITTLSDRQTGGSDHGHRIPGSDRRTRRTDHAGSEDREQAGV